jgi:outer membrane translocation and assembly module TamA
LGYVVRNRNEYDFKFKQNRFSLTLGNNFTHVLFNTSFYFETVDIYDNDFTEEINENLTYYFNNVGVIASLTLHDLDNVLNPNNGIAVKYQINPVFSDESEFYVNMLTGSIYKTVNHFTFSLKADIGKIFGNTIDVPLIYRFTLGGPYRMKAFDYREIGSMDSKGNVYGGESYAYGEIVAKYNIKNFLGFGPFYEIGMAEEDFNTSDFYKDLGILLEIKTPIGPLKFTYAVDVEKHTRRAFYITFGTTIP